MDPPPYTPQQVTRANPHVSYEGNFPWEHWGERENYEIPKVTGNFP